MIRNKLFYSLLNELTRMNGEPCNIDGELNIGKIRKENPLRCRAIFPIPVYDWGGYRG
jgi:hypothetical protein